MQVCLYCRHGKRQLGWPLTSGVNLQYCLYAGEAFVQWDHGMHPWALGVLIVENGYQRGP